MLAEKIHFLKEEYVPILRGLDAKQPAQWGKMDAQQMVEHMRDVCKVASGRIVLPRTTSDPETLAGLHAFLLSDQPFAKGIKAAALRDEPRPHKYNGMEEAIRKMKEELDVVFEVYAADPQLVLGHPVFGDLNFEMQIHYLHKHACHHLRQFGIE